MIPRFSLALAGLFAAASLLGAVPASAQTVTTGSLTGAVTDQQGGLLPGATVSAVHTPTGTTYSAVTQTNGRYSILNARVGGPYTVTVTLSGFKKEEINDVMVALGEERITDFVLKLETVQETVTVVGQTPPIDTTQPGAGAYISTRQVESLPTISRSMIDIVRVNPYFNAITSNNTVTAVSVAGRNARYNNIQIDGAVNNDLFGLAETGTPGGQTDAQPISLDAIQEFQLVVSPYDVRQGGFSGGGINAITKSGSNRFSGSAFYFGRNQNWIGKGVSGTKVANFSDQQGGFSLGGKIVQSKAFFFGNADWGRRSTPTGFCITGCAQQFVASQADVDRYFSILENRYGYVVPAAREPFSRTTDSDKMVGKVDLNLSTTHRLTIRHNYVKGLNDIGSPTTTAYLTPDGFYRFRSTTNSTVGQFNSTFDAGVNEFRIAYTRIRDRRAGQDFEPVPFPRITVRLQGTSQIITSGRENFSTANELDQDIVEIHDDFTWLRGSHTVTIGTHNEFFAFRNLFIRDNYGTYTFNNLDFFEQGLAQQWDHSFSATSDPKLAAEFGVNQLGFYIGDQWRMRTNLTITSGIRVDIPMFPDTPTANPVPEDLFGYATDVTPGGAQWSPRIGFNFVPRGGVSQQLRGGIGMFTGRTPYVWLSNQYGNTGIEFTRIGAGNNAANRIPFVTDVNNQPKTVTGASAGSFTNEIDVIDPDYKYPTLLRGNLAYDRELPWGGLVASGEVLFTNDIYDIKYQNLNRVPGTAVQAIDGRPIFTRVSTTLSDVILLTNSGEGSSWSTVLGLRRPFRNGWYAQGSYLFGRSNAIMDGTSSQAASNWGFVYVPRDPNNPPLSRSVYDPGHRINLSGSYEIPNLRWPTTTLSVYYSGQSGRPYTLSFSNDANSDNRFTNDLLYIPASAAEIPFSNGTYQDLLDFVQADPCLAEYIGRTIERNACRAPWQNQLDFRVNFGLPFNRVKAEITLDVLNLINLFSSDSGLQQYASFNQVNVVSPTVNSSTGQITAYNVGALTAVNAAGQRTFTKFLRDDLRSRWQMQLGGRIRF
jgi:hypothetical protein